MEEKLAFYKILPKVEKALKSKPRDPLDPEPHVAVARKSGDYYFVTTSTLQGWVQMFPPYIVSMDGEILRISKPGECESAKVVYEDKYLIKKIEHPDPFW